MTPETAIRAENLAKRYRSAGAELTVFEGLTFDLRRGEHAALMGPSGAGKSTLLHLLGGLDRPSDGTIYCGAKALHSLSDGELGDFRNREIGFVWQIQSLLPEFTALENVMMPLLIRGAERSEAAEAALRGLEEVGLRDRASHRAGELSGGEQQRAALARALVTRPRILLADEPTGNLDYRTGARIMDLLGTLHHSRGLTSLIATHNPEFARRADRILRLEHGQLSPSFPDSSPGGGEAQSEGPTYV